MRRAALLAVLVLLAFGAGLPAGEEAAKPAVAFRAVDVWVDAGAARLAAYQVEITYDAKRVEVVGVEGGEPAGFRDAPYFDEAGKTGGRIILAAFVPADAQSAAGRQRVARLHLQVEGGAAPELTVKLVAAARPGGERIKAKAGTGGPVPEEGKGK